MRILATCQKHLRACQKHLDIIYVACSAFNNVLANLKKNNNSQELILIILLILIVFLLIAFLTFTEIFKPFHIYFALTFFVVTFVQM